ncbi:hypothetical protein BC940DRAFT_22797 [Gongronella butleri]|nr:hypothetical protein BC940DRAFT_22797 [Gongronella butleri]
MNSTANFEDSIAAAVSIASTSDSSASSCSVSPCEPLLSPTVPSPALSMNDIKGMRPPIKEADYSSCDSLPLTPRASDVDMIIHDTTHYMFKMCLDTKGNTGKKNKKMKKRGKKGTSVRVFGQPTFFFLAALCYLPTRFAPIVEFYHTEIPVAYRNMGIGDTIVRRAFDWVQQLNLLVIPTCPFVRKYLNTHYSDASSGLWKFIVDE